MRSMWMFIFILFRIRHFHINIVIKKGIIILLSNKRRVRRLISGAGIFVIGAIVINMAVIVGVIWLIVVVLRAMNVIE